MRELLSSQAEDYLKTIYSLSQTGRVTTQAIADRLGVTPASVTGMLKKLNELGLVEHAPYQGASLTVAGAGIALELVRHHRLLELYLHQALGYKLEDVHAEAEKLEHHISEDFEAKISEILGNPTHDPHGEPIPTLDGTLPPYATRALSEVRSGEETRVGRISERDPELLRHFVSLGLTPGANVRVTDVSRAGGTITLEIAGSALHTISLEAAHHLFVTDPRLAEHNLAGQSLTEPSFEVQP
jgi:DtxR family Mn-dependent transcriptional regulator